VHICSFLSLQVQNLGKVRCDFLAGLRDCLMRRGSSFGHSFFPVSPRICLRRLFTGRRFLPRHCPSAVPAPSSFPPNSNLSPGSRDHVAPFHVPRPSGLSLDSGGHLTCPRQTHNIDYRLNARTAQRRVLARGGFLVFVHWSRPHHDTILEPTATSTPSS
jgi:hypothetical protein